MRGIDTGHKAPYARCGAAFSDCATVTVVMLVVEAAGADKNAYRL
jgi:hypothetical protein